MARDDAYREAEQFIEAARQEGATELDLSGMGLTEVEAIVLLLQPAEVQYKTPILPLPALGRYNGRIDVSEYN